MTGQGDGTEITIGAGTDVTPQPPDARDEPPGGDDVRPGPELTGEPAAGAVEPTD